MKASEIVLQNNGLTGAFNTLPDLTKANLSRRPTMANSSIRPTYERLKQLLDYTPATGLFTWKVRTSNRIKVGDVAGVLEQCGYISISIDRNKYKAHILARFYMTGFWPQNKTDHVDLCRSNNVWTNLREASNSQNGQNKGKLKNNTSGFKGVSWSKVGNKWAAELRVNGKRVFSGYFHDPRKAHEAYCDAALKFHGKFARFS